MCVICLVDARVRKRMHAGDGFNFNLRRSAKPQNKQHPKRLTYMSAAAAPCAKVGANETRNQFSITPPTNNARRPVGRGECSAVLLIQSRHIICSLWSDKLPSQGGYLIFTPLAGPDRIIWPRSWCSPASGIRKKNLYAARIIGSAASFFKTIQFRLWRWPAIHTRFAKCVLPTAPVRI